MKLEFLHAGRRPPWALWALAAVLAWLALVAAGVWSARRLGMDPPLCLFKQLTGVACPTCGLGRGGFSILQGHVLAGWLHNPLVFSLLGVGVALVLLRIAAGRALRLHLTRAEKFAVAGILAAAFLGNWVYVIVYVG